MVDPCEFGSYGEYLEAQYNEEKTENDLLLRQILGGTE